MYIVHLQQEPSEDDPISKKRSNHLQRKLANRKTNAKVDPHVEEQFLTGRVYGQLDVCQRDVSLINLYQLLCVCSMCVFETRPEWAVWWLHLGGKGVGILPEEAQIKKSKMTFSLACFAMVLPQFVMACYVQKSVINICHCYCTEDVGMWCRTNALSHDLKCN